MQQASNDTVNVDIDREENDERSKVNKDEREEKVKTRFQWTVKPIQATMKANTFGNVCIPIE